MAIARSNLVVAVVERKLYAIGGWNDEDLVLGSVECYDPKSDKWTPVADLNIARERASALVHDGYIYVVGGRGRGENTEALRSIERYNPETDTWHLIKAKMNNPRFEFGLAYLP